MDTLQADEVVHTHLQGVGLLAQGTVQHLDTAIYVFQMVGDKVHTKGDEAEASISAFEQEA